MTQRILRPGAWFLCMILATLGVTFSLADAQDARRPSGGAGPADPPPSYRAPPSEIKGPSVRKGQKAGIEVGQVAPDFELQPIEPYPVLRTWLGDDAPAEIEQKVKLSQLVGRRPILLLYGSYT